MIANDEWKRSLASIFAFSLPRSAASIHFAYIVKAFLHLHDQLSRNVCWIYARHQCSRRICMPGLICASCPYPQFFQTWLPIMISLRPFVVPWSTGDWVLENLCGFHICKTFLCLKRIYGSINQVDVANLARFQILESAFERFCSCDSNCSIVPIDVIPP